MLYFITYGLIIAFAAFLTYTLIASGWLGSIDEFMKILSPFLVLGVIFLIRLNFGSKEYRRRKSAGDTRIVLYLNYLDKIKFDFLVFLSPIIIMAIAFIMSPKPDKVDVIQALTVFSLMFIWQKVIFNKKGA